VGTGRKGVSNPPNFQASSCHDKAFKKGKGGGGKKREKHNDEGLELSDNDDLLSEKKEVMQKREGKKKRKQKKKEPACFSLNFGKREKKKKIVVNTSSKLIPTLFGFEFPSWSAKGEKTGKKRKKRMQSSSIFITKFELRPWHKGN